MTSMPRPPRRRRPPKAPQPALTAAIITTRKRGPKPPVEIPDDPEVDARVVAWFARNVRPMRPDVAAAET